MREILFKAKRKDNGEWVEGHLIQSPYMDEVRSWISTPDDKTRLRAIATYYADWRAVEVRTDTICQYTGLTDKNGNKIWENDVCNCIYDGRLSIRVIIWDKDELDFKGTNGKKNYGKEFDYLGCCEEIEVISNIFDNPKLIGE